MCAELASPFSVVVLRGEALAGQQDVPDHLHIADSLGRFVVTGREDSGFDQGGPEVPSIATRARVQRRVTC